MKTYILKPIMTPPTLSLSTSFDKPATVKIIPPRQPLPTAVIDPAKPMLKLGLDVHLEFIMAVAQKDHANPHAPRKFTREQLVAQAKKWVAEGFQVFCVQESCGFGFVLHRELVAAGTQSFLITPIALNGKRKTDKLDARALCLRLSRWLDGNRDELSPIRIPSEKEQRQREGTRRRKFLAGAIRSLANRGHSQVRVTNTSLQKSYSKTLLPIDNPHRGSGDLLGHGFVTCDFISNKSAPYLVRLPNGVQISLRFGDGDVLKHHSVKKHKCRDAHIGGAMHKHRAIIESLHDSAKCPEIL
jgi:hypothetical protein